MALMGGHRFAVSMGEVFPHGVYAMGVQQAEDFDERSGRRSPAHDKLSGELVWAVTVIDRDPEARDKQVKVKVSAPVMPVLPGEIMPGTGLHPVDFVGLTVTPYVNDGTGRRPRLAFSLRASGVVAQGKAPTGTRPVAHQPGQPGQSGQHGDGKAA